MTECPVCRHEGADVFEEDYGDKKRFDCYKCGKYLITGSGLSVLSSQGIEIGSVKAARLSHAVRRSNSGSEKPLLLNSDSVKRLLDTTLPNPAEAADSLILFLAELAGDDPGKPIDILPEEAASAVGAVNGQSIEYLLTEMYKNGLIYPTGDYKYRLSLDGWSRVEELQRNVAESRQAFMAMPFNNEELDPIFFDYWVPAVEKAGFKLVRLDSRQKAGLIDDRLRVEIRRSRFLIAELTSLNQGAYWEAGFATGLGRPVIYTCRKDEFDKTHFDTKHHLTIIWEPGKIDQAAQQLTDCIRETLPLEADLGSGEGA